MASNSLLLRCWHEIAAWTYKTIVVCLLALPLFVGAKEFHHCSIPINNCIYPLGKFVFSIIGLTHIPQSASAALNALSGVSMRHRFVISIEPSGLHLGCSYQSVLKSGNLFNTKTFPIEHSGWLAKNSSDREIGGIKTHPAFVMAALILTANTESNLFPEVTKIETVPLGLPDRSAMNFLLSKYIDLGAINFMRILAAKSIVSRSLAANSKLECTSSATCAESNTLVDSRMAFSLDCNRSAEKLPIISITNPAIKIANPSTSNGQNRLDFTNFPPKTNSLRHFFPKTRTTHFRHFNSCLNFTSTSALSSTIPIITTPAPNSASQENKPIQNVDVGDTLRSVYLRLEIATATIVVGVVFISLIFFIKIIFKKR